MAALTLVLAAPAAANDPGIEQPQLRTETSSTFRTGQDRWVTRFATSPLNFRDGAGAWQRVDTRLVGSDREGSAYGTAATPYGLDLPSDLGAGPVRFTFGAESVAFALTGARSRDVEVSGASARYPAALDGVDLRYDAQAEGVKETLVLRDASVPGAYSFRVSASLGLEPQVEEDGRVDFVRPDGKVAFRFASPYMEDAAGATSSAIKVSLQPRLDGWLMTLRPDAGWLRAEERTWPVRLDPTVRVASTHECAYIRQTSNAQASVCDNPDFVADNTGGAIKRPLMRFDVRSLPFGSAITNATLRLYSTGDFGSVSVHQALKPWTLAANWHTYDGVRPWTNLGGDYAATAAATTNVTSGWHSWNVTTLTHAWVNGQQPNDGLIVLGEPRRTHKFSTSQRPAQAPYLEVTFVSETIPPALQEPEHSPPLPTGWVDAVPLSVKGSAIDVGTGLQRMMLNRPTPSGTVTDTQFFKCDPTLSPTCNPDNETMCGGTWDSRCPLTGSKTFAYNTGTLAEGIVRPSLVARDAATNDSAPRDWQLKVDHTAPNVDWRGSLSAYEGTAIQQAGTYHLQVDVTDGVWGGTPSQQRSGVRSTELLVSKDEGEFVSQGVDQNDECVAPDSCSQTLTFEVRTADFGEGLHAIKAVAHDRLGHRRERTLRFFVDLEPPVVDSLDHSQPIDGWFGSQSLGVTADAHDDGTGVSGFVVTGAGPNGDVERRVRLNANGLPEPEPARACSVSTDAARRCVQDPPATPVAYSATELREGHAVPVRLRATDAVGRASAAREWTLRIDHGAPAFRSDFRVDAQAESTGGRTQVTWDGAADPGLADGSEGSQVAEYRYRVRINQGQWSAFAVAPHPTASVAGPAVGDALEVEVQAVDFAGNAGPSATATTTVGDPCGATVYGYPPSCTNDEEEFGMQDPEAPATLTEEQETTAFSASAEPAKKYRISVDGGTWVTIRSKQQSYVVGLAHDGWQMNVTDSVPVGEAIYRVGLVLGDYEHCGWVNARSTERISGSTESNCTTDFRLRDEDFAIAVNCVNKCGGGTPVGLRRDLTRGVQACAVVYPTPAEGAPTRCKRPIRDPIPPSNTNDGYVVEWRYVTKGGRYVMVKDRHYSNPEGSWVFFPISAFRRLCVAPRNCDPEDSPS